MVRCRRQFGVPKFTFVIGNSYGAGNLCHVRTAVRSAADVSPGPSEMSAMAASRPADTGIDQAAGHGKGRAGIPG